MADAATMRSAVESLMTCLLARGETQLAEQLVHPDELSHPGRRRRAVVRETVRRAELEAARIVEAAR